MEEKDNRVVLPFTLRNPSHPTTPKEVAWYEFLKRCHCHKCSQHIDCDVEEFLSCEVPLNVKFNKCNCFLCIEDEDLKKILQDYFREVRNKYKTKQAKKELAKRQAKKEPFQQKLRTKTKPFQEQPEITL